MNFIVFLRRMTVLAIALGVGASGHTAVPFRTPDVNRAAPVHIGDVPTGIASFTTAGGIDRLRGFVYVADQGSPPVLVKMRAATSGSPLTGVGDLSLDPGETAAMRVIVDEARGFGILLLNMTPTRLVKFSLTTGETTGAQRLDTLDLDPGESNFIDGAYDDIHGHLYLVRVNANPGQVVKVSAGTQSSAMTRAGLLTLEGGDGASRALVVDEGIGKGWVATVNGLVEIALDAGSGPPARTAFHQFSAMQVSQHAELDRLGQVLVGSPQLSSIIQTFDLSGTVPVQHNTQTGVNSMFARVAFDAASGLAFAGCNGGSVEGLAKFQMANSGAAPSLMDGVNLPPSAHTIYTTLTDPEPGFIYAIGSDGAAGSVRVFHQPAASGPELSGQFSRLGVRTGGSRSVIRGQMQVENNGTNPAGQFFVRLFLSNDRVLSHDDVAIGSARRVARLQPGQSRRIGFAAPVTSTPAGMYVIAVIDAEGAASDGHYGNNVIVSDTLP